MGWPVTGLIFAGTMPLPCSTCGETTWMLWMIDPSAFLVTVSTVCGVGNAMASRPGRITRNGNSIFGTAAISGTRRAESIFFEAIAVWITRKSVHQ